MKGWADQRWSSEVVTRVRAVRDVAKQQSPTSHVRLDVGTAFWIQVHACFPELQHAELAPGVLTFAVQEAEKSSVELLYDGPDNPWCLAGVKVKAMSTMWRRMQKRLFTVTFDCARAACTSRFVPNIIPCARLIFSIFLSLEYETQCAPFVARL